MAEDLALVCAELQGGSWLQKNCNENQRLPALLRAYVPPLWQTFVTHLPCKWPVQYGTYDSAEHLE